MSREKEEYQETQSRAWQTSPRGHDLGFSIAVLTSSPSWQALQAVGDNSLWTSERHCHFVSTVLCTIRADTISALAPTSSVRGPWATSNAAALCSAGKKGLVAYKPSGMRVLPVPMAPCRVTFNRGFFFSPG